jgi:hypothetical protein
MYPEKSPLPVPFGEAVRAYQWKFKHSAGVKSRGMAVLEEISWSHDRARAELSDHG